MSSSLKCNTYASDARLFWKRTKCGLCAIHDGYTGEDCDGASNGPTGGLDRC